MSTTPDPGKETRIVPISGHQVVVKHLNDTQLLMLAREGNVVTAKTTAPERRMQAAGRILTIIESAIVQESDREIVRNLGLTGELDMTDMMKIITVFQEKAAPNRATRRAKSVN